MRLRGSARTIVRISAAGALAGAVYSYLAHDDAIGGLVVGASNGAVVPWVTITLSGPAGASIRRLPFLGSLALRSALFLAVILLVNLVSVPLVNGFRWRQVLGSSDIVFAVAATVIGNLLLGVQDLLGPGVLFAFAAGRYHHPRLEERALLFVDLRASTATAERLGGERFLGLLNAFFTDLSAAIAENGGEIHKYVGDEIIATWRLAPGRNAASIVRAWAAARARLAARADAYQREFGLAPDFRAALHAGQVVVGELGALKKEIALIGDPMNTAARMLDACRDLDRAALASSTLLARLDRLPGLVEVTTIAPLRLRGKSEPLELFALHREGADTTTLSAAEAG